MTTRFRCGARIAGATLTTALLLIAGQASPAGAAVSSPGQADGCLRQGSFLDFRCPPDPDGRPVHIESGSHTTPSSYHRSRTTEHHDAAKAPAERAHVEQATAQGADPAAARAGAPEQAPTTNAAAPVTNAAAPQTNAAAPTTNAVAPQTNAPHTNAVAPAADHPSAQAVEPAHAATPDAPAAQAVPQAEASRSAQRTPTHHSSPAEPTVVNAPPAQRPPGRAHTTAKRQSTPHAHKQSPHSPSNRRLPASGA